MRFPSLPFVDSTERRSLAFSYSACPCWRGEGGATPYVDCFGLLSLRFTDIRKHDSFATWRWIASSKCASPQVAGGSIRSGSRRFWLRKNTFRPTLAAVNGRTESYPTPRRPMCASAHIPCRVPKSETNRDCVCIRFRMATDAVPD